MFDDPVVFRDPLALRILGMTRGKLELNDLRAPRRPYSRSLRAFVVARACLAEETLHREIAGGATQYLLLGAGLDTFAYRNPHHGVDVFEADHPATQEWKRQLLQKNGIQQPDTCRYVPVNFEKDDLAERLLASGFQPGASTVIAWLGVVPYLTAEAMRTTLRGLAALPGNMKLVMDYTLPREMLPPNEQLALDSLSARVAQAGEPFQQFFAPEEIERELGDSGWSVVLDLDSFGINARYFASRCDGFGVLGKGARLLIAEKL